MKLFIYDVNHNEIVAVINGKSHIECELKADVNGYVDNDNVEWSFTDSGLVYSEDVKVIK